MKKENQCHPTCEAQSTLLDFVHLFKSIKELQLCQDSKFFIGL